MGQQIISDAEHGDFKEIDKSLWCSVSLLSISGPYFWSISKI
jgi:hypothetical protein